MGDVSLHLKADTGYLNFIPDYFNFFRFGLTLVEDKQGDGCSPGTANLEHRFYQAHPFGAGAIYFQDDVASPDTCLSRRCARNRGDNS